MQRVPADKGKNITSPTELEVGDSIRIRGRILGSGKIGKRPGLIVLGVGCLVLAAIAYGIAHSGMHRPIGAVRQQAIAIAPQSLDPWWQNQSDAIHTAPTVSATPMEAVRLPVLPPGVPDLSQIDNVPRVIVGSRRNPQQPTDSIADLPPIPRIVGGQGTTLPSSGGDAPNSQADRSDHDAQDHGLHDALGSPLLVERQDAAAMNGGGPHTSDTKLGGLQAVHDADAPDAQPLQQFLGTFTISAGTVIPAALVTAIDSDIPGLLVAQVRQSTYDSATGRNLLIPQGSKIIGGYDSRIAYGQNRLLVIWQRLILPNGLSIDLRGMAGADMQGRSGFDAQVDNHTKKLFQGAILLSVIGAGAQLSQPQQLARNSSAQSVGQVIAGNLGAQIANTSTQTVQRQLNVPPNLRVPTGYQFNVVVDHDIVLSGPYQEY